MIPTRLIVHALTRAERQGRVPVGKSRDLLGDVLTTAPHFHPTSPLVYRAVEISSAMRVGVYDCLYVALAEQEGCEVVPSDSKMINALHKDFPFIKSLTTMP